MVFQWFRGLTSSRPAGSLGGWLPSRCAICRGWPCAPVCDHCIAHYAQPTSRCQRCALPLPGGRICGDCLNNPPPLDVCLSATAYAWPWIDLVAKLKFQAQPGWARPLATLMLSSHGVEDMLEAADWVLPIPLSRERLAERGYNQSWLLAQHLCPDKAQPDFLLRTRDTPSQRTLPRSERLANLEGAFALDPLQAPALRDKRVVLVDDVMTSGASLHTAARVLRQAGVQHISAVVLARTEAATEADLDTLPF
ncbi:phosphoribosyltransferase family protein [Limnohabitans radicicola]|uniref:ComF family protein n=1 Tax=Limnohabitans radicicola TaxID=2771427 RepID=A0A927FHF0_9BURK|nr:ComF family protein [Limnohabitans radicicola]MBD8051534.1 ComF family protein [Limnohabitans radicicola]